MFGPTVSPQLVQSGKGRIASDPALLNLPRPLMVGAFFRLWPRRTNLWRKVTSPARGPNYKEAETAARRNFVRHARDTRHRVQAIYSIQLARFHETIRPPIYSRARVRRVGLACRAQLRVVQIVLAKGRRS